MTRVTAPSRLHFGLLQVPTEHCKSQGGAPSRSFGGVGLMIDRPGVVVTVRGETSWRFEGSLASRAQLFAQRFVASLEGNPRSFEVLIERTPAEHTGLGVGTQLALATAKAIANQMGQPEFGAEELAMRTGRGERSGIGTHGFDRGGLIVESGKRPGETLSPLLNHVVLPDPWRVAVFAPPVRNRWHGQREREAFESSSLSPRKPGLCDTLCRIVMLELLPAALAGDLPGLGEAIFTFNRLAGTPFAQAQGGIYASPEIEDLIESIRDLGVKGVGQSSWGPTIFALTSSDDEANWLVNKMRDRVAGWVARPSRGHSVEG